MSGEANIEFIECDLGNLKQVKAVGDSIRQKEERLDIVCPHLITVVLEQTHIKCPLQFVGDAGVGVNKYGLSSDGIDRHFSVGGPSYPVSICNSSI